MKDKLTDYLTYDKPLGPEDASIVTDPYCRRALFQNENAIYKRLTHNPSLVLGRKGSGKTALLHCGHTLQDYRASIELNSASAFALLVRLIEKIGTKSIAVEPVADIWGACFWWALIFKAPSEFWSVRTSERIISPALRDDIGKYVAAITVRHDPTLAQFIVAALNYYQSAANQMEIAPEDFSDFISTYAVNGLTFGVLKERLCQEMEARQVKALLIIDSLDPRVDNSEAFDVARSEATLAISGLLKALGSFNRGNKVYDLRFALPSERHYQFLGLSTNPAKDMVKIAVMQWTAGDLVSVAAHRLSLFYREHAEFSGHYVTRYAKLDSRRRKDAVTLLQAALGRTVTNRLGVEESTISYVMRHTQLLPRHLLLYLNSIFSTARERGEDFENISGDSIRDGIIRVEQTICYEVFAAYRHKYPRATQVCEACIPELPLRFRFGDLQSVFNWHGKRTMMSDDFDEFKRMLIEMGVIGRLTVETDVYAEATFEYASPHQLVISTDDQICLHPVFSQVYHAKPPGDMKVVYPFGTDVEADVVEA